MNDHILNAIDEEIARLRQARAILGGIAATRPPARRRRKRLPRRLQKPGPRRKLSAKARRAIAEAQRKRWAKVKSQKKAATAAKKNAPTKRNDQRPVQRSATFCGCGARNDEMHTTGLFFSSLTPRYPERLFPRPPPALSSSQTTADRVRLLTRIHRLWFTVPENFHGPEIHRAFRLQDGGFRTCPTRSASDWGQDPPFSYRSASLGGYAKLSDNVCLCMLSSRP